MKKIFDRHERAVLMFSGGKDSLACVYLLKQFWDKITVVFVNTGNAFPETLEIVKKVASEVPSFFEAKSDVIGFKEQYGLPTDLVPIQNSGYGFNLTGEKSVKLVNGYECCRANIWQPGLIAAKAIGATLIIRGQRNDETAKSPLRSGHIQEGFELLFPIETWTKEDVFSYLGKCGITIPEHYGFQETSMDCMNCTAFLSKIADRKDYMKANHPGAHNQNIENIKKINLAVAEEFTNMKDYAHG